MKYCTEFHVSFMTETALNATQETDQKGPKNMALWYYAELALDGHREHAEALLLTFQKLAEASIIPPPAMLAYLANAVIRHNKEGVSVDSALGLTGKKTSEGLEALRAGAVWGVVNRLIKNGEARSIENAADILEASGELFPSVKDAQKKEPLTATTIKSIIRKSKKMYWPWYLYSTKKAP